MRLLILATFALVFAGCAEPTTDDVAAPEPQPEAETIGATVYTEAGWVFDEVEYSFDGSIGYQAFTCAVVTCTGTGYGAWDNVDEVDRLGGVALSMAWEGPNEMAFGLANSCDGSCDFVTLTSGSSPLSISASDLDPEHTYKIVAWHPYKSAQVTGAQVGPQTDFTFSGTIIQGTLEVESASDAES